MDHTIARRLNGLLRRFRLFHMLWSLTIVWIVIAIVGYWLLSYGRQVNGLPSQYVQIWIAAFGIGTLACWWYARIKHRDLRSIAALIESRFPSLEQRLTTAVELRPTEESGRFTYLQRSVISEALVHDVRHEWDSLVSMRRMLIAALAGLPSLIAICAVGFALLKLPKTTIEPFASKNSSDAISSKVLPPEVVPGNTEVQKGDSIIVTARFPGQLPGKVWLVRQPLSESEKSVAADSVDRQLMKQSLSDPLFAAYLNDIRRPVEYRIEYDAEKTQNFSVKVFECPEVVRADAKLSYPLYTNLDPKEIADTRRVAAPIGTTLTWIVHLSKPIASGKLVPKSSGDHTDLVIDKENPLLASCSLVVMQNAQWNVQLVDSDDRQNKIDFSLRVSALANKEPTLKLTSGGDAVVSALQEFEIVAKVKDDYTLTSVGIGYQLADGELIEHELEAVAPADAKKSKDSTVSTIIDFEALNAQPDQLLSYYLWAEDIDENGEPRRIATDMYFAEVRPFDEIFRQSDQNTEQQEQQQQQQNQNGQQQGGQGEELLELQKQIISASWNINRQATSKGLPTRSKEDLETVAQSQTQAIEMLAEVAAQAEGDQEAEVAVAQASMIRAVEQLEKATESLKKSDLSKAIGFEQQAYQSLLKLQPKERQVGRSQRSQQSQQRSSRQQQRQQQLNQMELDQEENRYQDERKAQEEQDSSQQSETRQIASRLRELAMRQQDLNQQLRDVEAALQAAENKEQREELEQRLERLRQQQQQILEDTDELQDKLQESQNPNMQETQEQLQQTRENLQQANQSLRENNTGQALASGSRAQEQLEEMREEVRQQAANQFGETMQQMRGQAGELQQRQEELVRELQNKETESSSTGLRDAQQKDPEQSKELIRQQREQLEKLTDRMQETIEQAEESEPLLAQKLFDGYRRTQQEGVDEQLKNTENLMNRRLESQAQNQAEATLEDLKSLNNDISQAADSVLGSDLNSMRMALDQLDVARQQIENEIARETGRQPGANREANGERSQQDGQPNQQQQPTGGTQSNENPQDQNPQSPNQRGQNQPGQNQEGQEPSQQSVQRSSQSGQQQPGQQQPGQQQPVEQQGQRQGEQQSVGQPGQQQSGQQPGQPAQQTAQQTGQQPSQQAQQQQPGQQEGQAGGRQGQQQRQRPGLQQSGGNQQPGLRNGSIDPADAADDATRPGLLGGNGLNPREIQQASPITGEDFRQWSDRLRDVEELISDPELRWQATRIRQAARNLRTEVQRGSKAPQWSDVEDLVATPLRELQRKVSRELLRRAAEQTEIVPVDRDPVPNQYRDMVREYYERLGKGR